MMNVRRDQQVRCLQFLSQEIDGPPIGQQASRWLPKGEYEIVGTETITVVDFGRAQQSEALRIHNGCHVYYVATNYAEVNR